VSLVLFVQIATIWVTLRASKARRRLREVTTAFLVGDQGRGHVGLLPAVVSDPPAQPRSSVN
jgi:hypothetical protein